MATIRWGALVGAFLLAAVSTRAEDPPAPTAPAERALLTFDEGQPAATWGVDGICRHSFVDVVDAPAGPGPAPRGKALSVSAPRAGALVASGFDLPKDWRGFRAVSFWVWRDEAEAVRRPTGRYELQVIEDGAGAYFRRVVELQHVGWTRVWLPLRWFRWGDGRVPRWDRIAHLGFVFPEGAELLIDTVTLAPEDASGAAQLTVADLRNLAFPGADEGASRVVETPDAVVLTDAPDLDPAKLARHLADVKQAVYQTFPFLDPAFLPPVVIVFRTHEAYQDFPPRFAQRLNGLSGEPQSGGYTIMGIATSAWNAKFGQDRPVVAHEYVHALLSLSALLPNHGDWAQEGLASLFQLRFHPQEDIAAVIAKGVADPRAQTPLRELCGGGRIPLHRYWQAMTVWETLLANGKYAPKLPELFRAFRETRTTDLGRHLTLLGATWEDLTREWQEHCTTKYGAGK